ncbi:MAG TPA: type 4a pilus biogenesis protein PilO [Candidatus Baltobacteraceae bacterium]|nr:type 4a pilus biogenesis protein PilO [Candidatus Baltobacteraceae bacterium]
MASLSQSKMLVWIGRNLMPAGLALVGVLLALGYLFVFRPEFARIRQADRTARLQEERTAKEAYLKKLDQLNAAYEAYDAEDVERIRMMIPNEEDTPGLMAILEAAAQASDLQLTTINFAAGDTTGLPSVQGLGALNISISVQHGNYERFKLFLESLETNLRLFDVRSANINPVTASYSLTIRAYVWTAGKPATARL